MPEGFELDNLFESVEDTSTQQIMKSLITKDDSIALKTEIPNPLALTKLKMYEIWFRNNNYTKTADTIQGFIDSFLEYMVSNQRKSLDSMERMISAINAANSMMMEGNKDRWFGGEGGIKK